MFIFKNKQRETKGRLASLLLPATVEERGDFSGTRLVAALSPPWIRGIPLSPSAPAAVGWGIPGSRRVHRVGVSGSRRRRCGDGGAAGVVFGVGDLPLRRWSSGGAPSRGGRLAGARRPMRCSRSLAYRRIRGGGSGRWVAEPGGLRRGVDLRRARGLLRQGGVAGGRGAAPCSFTALSSAARGRRAVSVRESGLAARFNSGCSSGSGWLVDGEPLPRRRRCCCCFPRLGFLYVFRFCTLYVYCVRCMWYLGV